MYSNTPLGVNIIEVFNGLTVNKDSDQYAYKIFKSLSKK